MSNIVQLFSDKHLLSEDETLVLSEGLDDAVIGITTTEPKRAVYDYWRCIDVLLRMNELSPELSFDEALEFLDEYIEEITKLDLYAPIFIKPL